MKKIFMKSIALLLCLTLLFSNSIASLANGNDSNETNYETEESIEECVDENTEEDNGENNVFEELNEDLSDEIVEDFNDDSEENIEDESNDKDIEEAYLDEIENLEEELDETEYEEEPEEDFVDVEEDLEEVIEELEETEEDFEEVCESNVEQPEVENEENTEDEIEEQAEKETEHEVESVAEETTYENEESETNELDEIYDNETIEDTAESEVAESEEALFNNLENEDALGLLPEEKLDLNMFGAAADQAMFQVNGGGTADTLMAILNGTIPNNAVIKCISGGRINYNADIRFDDDETARKFTLDFNNCQVEFRDLDDDYSHIFFMENAGSNITIKNLINPTSSISSGEINAIVECDNGKLNLENITIENTDVFPLSTVLGVGCDDAPLVSVSLKNINAKTSNCLFEGSGNSNSNLTIVADTCKCTAGTGCLIFNFIRFTNLNASIKNITIYDDATPDGLLFLQRVDNMNINLNNNVIRNVDLPLQFRRCNGGVVNITNETYFVKSNLFWLDEGTAPSININSGNFEYGVDDDTELNKYLVNINGGCAFDASKFKILSGKFKSVTFGKCDEAKADLEQYAGVGKVTELPDGNDYNYEIKATPKPTPTPSPSHGGSSGGGGGSGRPVYDNQGNILKPGATLLDNNIKVVTGSKQSITITANSQLVDWNKTQKTAETKPIVFVNESNKFVDTATNKVVSSDWVGVVTANGNINWYFTSQDGTPIQSQLMQIGDGVFCFGDNGVMLTGNVQIGNEMYYFNEAKGAGEGAFIKKVNS